MVRSKNYGGSKRGQGTGRGSLLGVLLGGGIGSASSLRSSKVIRGNGVRYPACRPPGSAAAHPRNGEPVTICDQFRFLLRRGLPPTDTLLSCRRSSPRRQSAFRLRP
jgi:hypothetical protein